MKKFLLTFLTIVLMAMFFHTGAQARTSNNAKIRSSKVHRIEKNLIFNSVSNTIEPKDIAVIHEYNFTKNIVKNYSKHNGVNCSFFDPKTLKVFGVLITDKDRKVNTIYNRPTLIITQDNKVYTVEGNLRTLDNIKYAVGAGGYLTIDGKVSMSNNTHFTNGFYSMKVNRTVVAITKDNKLKFMVYRNKSLYSIAKELSKDSSIQKSLLLDGGSSTQNRYCNNGRKIPVSIVW